MEESERDELKRDFQAAADAETSFWQTQTGLVAATVAALGLLAAVAGGCEPGGIAARLGIANIGCTQPDALAAAAPAVPIAVLALVATTGYRAAIRSHHLRALENKLSRSDMPHVSYFTIDAKAASLRNGPGPLLLLHWWTLAAAVAFFGGATAYIGASLPWRWAAAMIACYLPAAIALIAVAIRSATAGRSEYARATDQGSSRPKRRPLETLKIIFLPKPQDLVKAFIIPGATLLLMTASTFDSRTLLGAIAVSIGFDVLLYQARYQYNDIRDIDVDSSPPGASSLSRAPTDRAGLQLSLSTLALRIFLSYTLSLFGLFDALRSPIAWLSPWAFCLAIVVVTAAFYEIARAWGAWGRAPKLAALAIFACVGLGYGARFFIASQIAETPFPSYGPYTFALFGLVFGCSFVAYAWALAATAYGDKVPESKPHLKLLFESIRNIDPKVAGMSDTDRELAKPLRESRQIGTPWGYLTLAATASSLFLIPSDANFAWKAMVAAIALTTVTAAQFATTSFGRVASLSTLAGAAATVITIAIITNQQESILPMAATAAPAAIALAFGGMSYADTQMQGLESRLTRLGETAARVFLGDRATDTLFETAVADGRIARRRAL